MENIIKISASIVVYNEDKETLKRVIENFLAINLEKELVIIDNSSEVFLQDLCENYSCVQYVFNGQNIGFGAGHNLAFSYLSKKSDLHMVINPDVYFDSVDMENFLKWMANSKDISLSIPKVLNPNGTVQNVVRNIPTILSLLKRKLHIDSDELIVKDNCVQEIPFAHGCFLIFKTDIFKALDGFDERFFMYMEDVDIFVRAKKYGKTVINPTYRIYHEYRKASSKNLKLFLWHLISVIKFFWKYR